jgi:hypothetical protein
LDLDGTSRLVSDARNIPVEALSRWFLPDLPLRGTGSYHLLFEGGLEDPLMTASFTLESGRIGKMDFDLFSGLLKAKENTLYVGTSQSPVVLSRKGLFNFQLSGKAPLAFKPAGWLKIKDREMDLRARMEKGDFSLILLAGLAEEASGAMDLSARIAGTLDHPVLTLDLDLKDCRMVPRDRLIAKSIEEIGGRIKVRNNRLAVEDLNGRIGQGRVFITSAPIAESRMELDNFIPSAFDFRVRTVGEKGLLLSIPTIMREGEWGEVHFYGATREDPLLIHGTPGEPRVTGTALLDSGHYTFPPIEATTKGGEKIEFRQLAGVVFDLKLASGRNTWYSNEFNTQYLEVKVDPGQEINLRGKDSDRTPLEAGIKCTGSASTRTGWLRYLGREFKVEQASIYIPKGKLPVMQGRGKDRLESVEVASAGGIPRLTNVDIWVDFRGTFGNIDFTLDSSPRFDANPENHQKILLSYVVFGQDMTGLTREEAQSAYEQRVGEAAGDAILETLDRITSSSVTKWIRPLARELGGLEVDFKSNILRGGDRGALPGATPGTGPPVDAAGNTLAAQSESIARVDVRKYLDQRLHIRGGVDLSRDPITERAEVLPDVGMGIDINKNISVNLSVGQANAGEREVRGEFRISQDIPDIIGPKKGDKDPPRFERFDIYPLDQGKFQLLWDTDEVTKSEITAVDGEGRQVLHFRESGQHRYRHDEVFGPYDPDQEYTFKICVQDPNGNETCRSLRTAQGSP